MLVCAKPSRNVPSALPPGFNGHAIFANRLAVVAHKLQFDDFAPAVGHVSLLGRRLAFERARRVGQILARVGDTTAQ